MERQNATISEFYRMLQGSFESNNHAYKVKATVYDGSREVEIAFEAPKGFAANQRQRQGKLEIKV